MFLFDYFPDGKLRTRIQQSWGVDGKRENNYRHTFDYNANNKIQTIITENWINSQWARYYISTYNYNNFSDLIEIYDEIFDNGVKKPNSKTIYSNYQYGKYSEATTQIFSNNIWNNYSKRVRNFDSMGNVSQEVRQFWNISTNSWDETSTTSFSYDNNENVIYKTIRNKIQDEWRYSYFDYVYDGDNNLLKERSLDSQRLEIYSINYTYGNGVLLNIINPKQSEILKPDQTYYLDWIQNKVERIDLELSTNNGFTWSEIGRNINSNAQFEWKVPNIYADKCILKISNSQDISLYSISDEFIIDIIYLNHVTNNISMSVFNNGLIGRDDYQGMGGGLWYLNNYDVLYSGGIAYGNDVKGITGMIGSFRFYDMENKTKMKNFYTVNYFNQKTNTTYTDISSSNKYGVEVFQESYSNPADDIIFIKYTLKNISGNNITDFYLGLFADWDIGEYSKNLGGYIIPQKLVYQYDPSTQLHFGIVALNGIGGGKVTTEGSSDNRYDLIAFLKSNEYKTITTEGDHRSFISSGPFNISSNGTISASFAIISGLNLTSLTQTANRAISLYNSGIVGVENIDGKFPISYSLSQNYPNPFNPSTVISYQLPVAEKVVLKVYDMLGREIATLVNEEKLPGNYEVKFEGSNLPSGTYFYRLQTGSFSQTKKLLLLK